MKSGGRTTGMPSGAKLTRADCDAVWMKATIFWSFPTRWAKACACRRRPSNAATITETEAQQYVTDVAANPDKDCTLDKMEFTKACEGGLVKQ